jgi:hypothetical protein
VKDCVTGYAAVLECVRTELGVSTFAPFRVQISELLWKPMGISKLPTRDVESEDGAAYRRSPRKFVGPLMARVMVSPGWYVFCWK